MAGSRSFTTPKARTPSGTRAGSWRKQGLGNDAYSAFIPKALPPSPPLLIDDLLQRRLEAAGLALGRLDGIGRLLPGPDEWLYSYVRKEAVLSSQIEGTQSSLADLVLHENSAVPGVPVEDAQEVSNYIAALHHGITLLNKIPISLRLIREVHEVLISGSRGEHNRPGEFRTRQNWIGGASPATATFVPPPPGELTSVLGKLEQFIHSDRVPTLIKVGLVHVQFETIHPFLDGNGRVGRMLIPLMMVAEGLLERPWLYMSLHFKRHRKQYYDLLQSVRTHGTWEDWMAFFLEGVAIVADSAVEKVRQLIKLFDGDRAKVGTTRGGSIYGRAALHMNLEVYEHLRKRIAIRIPETAVACGTTKPTVGRALQDLEEIGIAKEVTGRPKNRLYVYQNYLDILNRDAAEQGVPADGASPRR